MKHLSSHLRFLKKKPKAGLRLLWNTFLTRLGIQRLRNTQIALTYNCNFNCEMCSAEYLKKDKQDLTPKEVEKIWKQIKKLGVVHVDLTGGEPTVIGDEKLCDIISRINKKNDVVISMATNGWLLNKERLEKYKKAGLDSIFISIHSTEPEKHDNMVRTKNSYKKAMKGAKISDKMGFNVCINCVLHPGNFSEVEKLADICETNDWLLLINPMAHAGKWSGKTIADFWERYQKLLKKTHTRADTTFNYRGRELCPGGIEKWYITAYGEVMQCSFVHVSYGNILKEPAKDIYNRILGFEILRKKSNKCKHLFDKEFQEKWHDPLFKKRKLPISILEHPNLSKADRNNFKGGKYGPRD